MKLFWAGHLHTPSQSHPPERCSRNRAGKQSADRDEALSIKTRDGLRLCAKGERLGTLFHGVIHRWSAERRSVRTIRTVCGFFAPSFNSAAPKSRSTMK